MQNILSFLPTSDLLIWYAIRAAGLITYFLFFIMVSLGISIGGKIIPKQHLPRATKIHRTLGPIAISLGLVHAILLLFHQFLHFSFLQVFVPFLSDYRPELTSLGTLALYVFLTIGITSFMIKKLGFKTWKWIHLTTYIGFTLVFIHGILIGSDADRLPIRIMYYTTAAIVLVLLSLRIKQKLKAIAAKKGTIEKK